MLLYEDDTAERFSSQQWYDSHVGAGHNVDLIITLLVPIYTNALVDKRIITSEYLQGEK